MGLMFCVMILKDARRSELCGLHWCDLSADARVLTIRRTLLQLGGKLTKGTPKTRAGVRWVYLGQENAALLRAHWDAQLAASGRAAGMTRARSSAANGTPWNRDHVSKRFRRLAAGAGVPVIKLYEGGRHTNSLMHDAGMRRDLVMREVGHSDQDTNDRYSHALDEAYLAGADDVEP
jgi:integrase